MIGGQENIRYCGSPIALSFDETTQQKSVCLVGFSGSELTQITPLEIPTIQPLQSIKGSLNQIEQQLEIWKDYQGDKPVWLDIEVASQDYLADIQQRIEALTQDLPVEVVILRRARKQIQGQSQTLANETLSELTVEDVFLRRLAQESLEDPEREQRLFQLFQQSYDALQLSKES